MSIKLLNMGLHSSGKSCLKAGLLARGYTIFSLDFDVGLEQVKSLLENPKYGKDARERLYFRTLTDSYKSNIRGDVYPSKVTAWVNAMMALEDWREGGRSLGNLNIWGKDVIIDIDSFTGASVARKNAYLNSFEVMTPSGKKFASQVDRGGYHHMQDVKEVQDRLRSFVKMLQSKSILANVIINCHVTYSNTDGTIPSLEDVAKDPDLLKKLVASPKSIGNKYPIEMPGDFNHTLHCVRKNEITTIHCKGSPDDPRVMTKTGAPGTTQRSYSGDFALADYFKDCNKGWEPWQDRKIIKDKDKVYYNFYGERFEFENEEKAREDLKKKFPYINWEKKET